MNIEDRDRTKHTRIQAPNPLAADTSGRFQIKMIFVIVAVVTVTWVGVLIYLARELLTRAFA